MRTILAVIGALFLFALLSLIGLFAFGWQRMGPLKKEAVAYVDDALPDIVKGWNGEALLEHATPEFRAALTPDKLEELMMSGISQFGPMTNYAGAECQVVRVEIQSGEGEHAEAECAATASFARVAANIRTTAVMRRKAWRLSALYVQSAGEGAPLQRTAHAGGEKLAVLEASLAEGFVAVSARGRDAHIGAGVGGVEDFLRIGSCRQHVAEHDIGEERDRRQQHCRAGELTHRRQQRRLVPEAPAPQCGKSVADGAAQDAQHPNDRGGAAGDALGPHQRHNTGNADQRPPPPSLRARRSSHGAWHCGAARGAASSSPTTAHPRRKVGRVVRDGARSLRARRQWVGDGDTVRRGFRGRPGTGRLATRR